MPSSSLRIPKFTNLPHVKLSDPIFAKLGKVDLIIGIYLYAEIIENERIRVSGGIYARTMVFGWTACGSRAGKTNIQLNSSRLSIDSNLKQF